MRTPSLPLPLPWLALLCLGLGLGTARASLSGLYASNGLDQTVIQRLATPQEKRFVEREILSLLGLERRPRAAALHHHHHHEHHHEHRHQEREREGSAVGPAPRFLLGVYDELLRLQQQQGGEAEAEAEATAAEARAFGFDLSGYDRAVLDKSDVIVGFVSRPRGQWGGEAARGRHVRGRRLWFDAAAAPPPEALLGAELRLFQRPPPPPPADHPDHPPDERFLVALYQLLPMGRGQGEALLQVDEVNATRAPPGGAGAWLLLNATAPLAAWAAAPAANLGLQLAVRRARDGHEVHPSAIGLVAEGEGEGEGGEEEEEEEEDKQPFMVGFFKSPPAAPRAASLPPPRAPRTSRRRNPFLLPSHRHDDDDDDDDEDEDEEEEEEEEEEMEEDEEEGGRRVRAARDTASRKRRKSASSPAELQGSQWASRSCQMLELYVNFKDLRWQDWIIAPAGFQAFYCSGECNFPLNAHMNATNHAIVQTLVHLMNPLKVPKPCCAPTKLGPIQILYYLEDSNVTLKRYKNMVVKSCGCH